VTPEVSFLNTHFVIHPSFFLTTAQSRVFYLLVCLQRTVVLYGCEIGCLILREEQGLRVFGNRVLRRIFAPKREGVTGGWRKLRNEELHNLYSSPSIIRIIKSRRMRWAEHVARMGEKRNVYSLFLEK
jgi:hypothetical protein